MKKILILYTQLMPYNIVVVKELLKLGCVFSIVRHTNDNASPYIPPLLDNVTYYDRSQFSTKKDLLQFVRSEKPDLIWTSGWMDPLYNKVVEIYRKEAGIPVVAGSDTQWRGGKQWLNVLFSPFRHKRWFSHIWVSGVWQYEYARKLRFDKRHILMHNLSADTELFEQVNIEVKKNVYPKNILYIGRFVTVKGLSALLEAWQSIPDRKGWTLTLIGNGPLKESFQGYPDVIIKDFMSQEELIHEMQNSGAFILPSLFEPWALVLHEAAAAGLPILASERCGAVPYFVVEGYNGYTFMPEGISSISASIRQLICKSPDELMQMSYRSRELSKRITPKLVSMSLLSVLQFD